MLILGRKEKQSIVVGDQIKITVVRVSGAKVVLGVEAPDRIRILRDELVTTEEDSCPVLCEL